MHLNSEERKAFQHNLNRLIDTSGLSLSKAAKIAGVSYSNLHAWSNGRWYPQSHKKANAILAKLSAKALKAEQANGTPVDMPRPTETTAAAVRRVAKEANHLINTTGVKASVNPDGTIRFGMTIWYE